MCLENPVIRSKLEVKKRKFDTFFSTSTSKGNCGTGDQKKYFVYEPNTVSNATAKRWFQRFCSGNVDVEDETRSCKPIVEKVDKIIKESDQHASTYSITQELKIDQKNVWNLLHNSGLNLLERLDAYNSLLKCNKIDLDLERMVIRYEKKVT